MYSVLDQLNEWKLKEEFREIVKQHGYCFAQDEQWELEIRYVQDVKVGKIRNKYDSKSESLNNRNQRD